MSEAMERTKSNSDETASVVVVTPPESTAETKEEKPTDAKAESGGEEAKDGEDEKKDGEEKKDEEEKVMIGSVSDSKDLYAKYDQHGRRSWSETPPDGLEEAAENEQTQKYAVLVRKSEL